MHYNFYAIVCENYAESRIDIANLFLGAKSIGFDTLITLLCQYDFILVTDKIFQKSHKWAWPQNLWTHNFLSIIRFSIYRPQ